jgi:hypothetical protein
VKHLSLSLSLFFFETRIALYALYFRASSLFCSCILSVKKYSHRALCELRVRAAAEEQLRRLAEAEAREALARVRAEEALAREAAVQAERGRAAQEL